jgi:hypothetical protein
VFLAVVLRNAPLETASSSRMTGYSEAGYLGAQWQRSRSRCADDVRAPRRVAFEGPFESECNRRCRPFQGRRRPWLSHCNYNPYLLLNPTVSIIFRTRNGSDSDPTNRGTGVCLSSSKSKRALLPVPKNR